VKEEPQTNKEAPTEEVPEETSEATVIEEKGTAESK